MESPAKSKRLVGRGFFKPGRVFRVLWHEPRFGKSAIVQYIDRLEDEYKGFFYARKRPTLPDTVHPQVHRGKKQHTGRKLDVADLLFDTLGAPSELGPHDISLILHFLKYLLTCLLFCNFSIFPGTIRPRCTTMPWTIWPALVVLWGVCWMFRPPRSDARSDAQFEHCGTSHSEIENSQPGPDIWLGWDPNPIQDDFENAQTGAFQTDSLQWYPSTESPWSLAWTMDQPVTVNPPSSAPWIDMAFENTTYSAGMLQATESLQLATYGVVSSDDSHGANLALLALEARSPDNLAIGLEQDPRISSATSSAPAGYSSESTAQHGALVRSGNANSSNHFVAAAERSFKCTLSNCDAPPFGNKEVLNEHLKEHDRSFRCDAHGCHLVFLRAYELNRHKQAVHGEGKRFPCPKSPCKYSTHGSKGPFGRKDKLREHIKNVHLDVDLASVPELQQLPRPARPPIGSEQRVEDEPESRISMTAPSRKRGRNSSAESSDSEAQESSDTEVKRLRRMVEELREEKRQTGEKHMRELEDLKEEKRRLWKMVEDLMRRG